MPLDRSRVTGGSKVARCNCTLPPQERSGTGQVGQIPIKLSRDFVEFPDRPFQFLTLAL